MKIEPGIKLDFSDVLIHPRRSTLTSRSEVDLEREYYFKHSKQTWKGIPIITSNMSGISSFELYNVLKDYHMITCFHKFYNVEDYPLSLDRNYYAISTGIKDADWEKTSQIIKRLNPLFLVIDVANGYTQRFVETIRRYREAYPNMILIGGNVASREMVEELSINGGLDLTKVGIGNGAVCTTRLMTGCGVPQLSAVIECSDASHGVGTGIVADGGMNTIGDLCKAFAAGADFCMSGSLFSGHAECPGELIEKDGKKYKKYYGMSSKTAMDKHHGGVADYRGCEGKTVNVLYKGPVKNTMRDILGGLRSCCTYTGARCLKDLSKCTTFICVNNQANKLFS